VHLYLPHCSWNCIPELSLETLSAHTLTPHYLNKVAHVAWPRKQGQVVRENRERPAVPLAGMQLLTRPCHFEQLLCGTLRWAGMHGYGHVGLTIDVRRSSRAVVAN
jgi:hypothetical protein